MNQDENTKHRIVIVQFVGDNIMQIKQHLLNFISQVQINSLKPLIDDNCRKQVFQVYLDGQQTSCLNKSKDINISCTILSSCVLDM